MRPFGLRNSSVPTRRFPGWRVRVPYATVIALSCSGVFFPAGCSTHDSSGLTVFAAASLTDVVEVLADSFEIRTGRPVRLNIAASSVLARQIERGARADVFLSADPAWGQYLIDVGVAKSMARLPVGSRLVFVSAAGNTRHPEGSPRLTDVHRLALGDPSHVPAGRYARSWLQCMHLWQDLEDRIVPTLDVRAALAAVVSGAADGAVVYASDVASAGVQSRIRVTRLDDSCQPEIAYAAVVMEVGEGLRGEEEFVEFFGAPEHRPTWERFGFDWR